MDICRNDLAVVFDLEVPVSNRVRNNLAKDIEDQFFIRANQQQTYNDE